MYKCTNAKRAIIFAVYSDIFCIDAYLQLLCVPKIIEFINLDLYFEIDSYDRISYLDWVVFNQTVYRNTVFIKYIVYTVQFWYFENFTQYNGQPV